MVDKECVIQICQDVCNRQLNGDELLFSDHIISSYMFLKLLTKLESQFEIEFLPDEISDINNFETIDKIIELITSKRR